MRIFATVLLLSALLVIPALVAPVAAAAEPCRLAPPPPPPDPDPSKRPPPYESEMRQQCEDELDRDDAWWFNLEGRLRHQVHKQAAAEVTTNNRHVVYAYAAMWLIAVGFVVLMWRKQQALRAEIERLGRELEKAEGGGGGASGGGGAAA